MRLSLAHFLVGAQLPRVVLEHHRYIVPDRKREPVGLADELRLPPRGRRAVPCRSGRRGCQAGARPRMRSRMSSVRAGSTSASTRTATRSRRPKRRHFTASFSVISTKSQSANSQILGPKRVVVRERVRRKHEAHARERRRKIAAGLPMPATACSLLPDELRRRQLGRRVSDPVQTRRRPVAWRTPGHRPAAVDHHRRIHAAAGWLAQRTRRKQQAVARGRARPRRRSRNRAAGGSAAIRRRRE